MKSGGPGSTAPGSLFFVFIMLLVAAGILRLVPLAFGGALPTCESVNGIYYCGGSPPRSPCAAFFPHNDCVSLWTIENELWPCMCNFPLAKGTVTTGSQTINNVTIIAMTFALPPGQCYGSCAGEHMINATARGYCDGWPLLLKGEGIKVLVHPRSPTLFRIKGYWGEAQLEGNMQCG